MAASPPAADSTLGGHLHAVPTTGDMRGTRHLVCLRRRYEVVLVFRRVSEEPDKTGFFVVPELWPFRTGVSLWPGEVRLTRPLVIFDQKYPFPKDSSLFCHRPYSTAVLIPLGLPSPKIRCQLLASS